MEKLIKVKNNTGIAFKEGELCYIKDENDFVLQVGRCKLKCGWIRRLLRMKPQIEHVITDVNTSDFKKGERLYLDPNNAGGLISHQ